MSLQRRLIHLKPIQRIAACAQGLEYEVLHSMLRTTQRRKPHHRLSKGELIREPLFNRLKKATAELGIEGHAVSRFSGSLRDTIVIETDSNAALGR